MNKTELLQKIHKAKSSGNRFYELIIFGMIDDSGEEKWQSLSLGAQGKDHKLSKIDCKDIRELLGKWVEYLKEVLNENCEGTFTYGKIAVVDFITGNSAERVPKRIAATVQKHWQNLTAQAIKDGMQHEGKEERDDAAL